MLYSQKNHSNQRGQALSEYAPTFPAVVAILIISATTISTFLQSSFKKAIDGLNGVSACVNTDDSREGPAVAMVGPHRVSLIGVVYNAADNTTGVTYRVESLANPSISHWTLGIPKEVADAILEVNEQYAWTNSDPTTGASGIKFDTGYETADGAGGGGGNTGGGNDNGGGNNGGGGNNNDKGGGKKSGALPLSFTFAKFIDKDFSQTGTTTTYTADPMASSRDIFVLLSGQYEFQQTTVTIKAGQEPAFTGVISAPVPVETVVSEGC